MIDNMNDVGEKGSNAVPLNEDIDAAPEEKESSAQIQRPPPPLMDLDKGLVGWESEDDQENPQ